ncbi:ABC transporter ATP-binding protein [Ureibacillus chungkukjangi]|uniref:ABC-2 type transport system ATP-binding protein n=1 Tax=Ureibacillus chungkukjangi TaxID=1202712 RepID=A0A318TTZ4_9BACL|nr:ABC transporter ATP-binding protein [Ureibacillus chungkukjangi]PYF08341.1 ABC-2 type transport system ATP-binding protein [Ureibacillus chungkukjangi]
MLELKNIGVNFSGRDILKEISITFQPGEIIGLVAPNGTGKSTLMNVIMNYLRPNSGKVVFNNGLEYSSKKNEVKIHQLVSMMPDQSDLYNHLSGRQHLKIYSSMWNSNPELIDSTIKALGMESYVNKKTGTYSLGMRQRLCFAMQIVSDTQIMLMDEVMNGLDPTQVEIISQMLVKKKAEGKTIIIASHLLENLEKYADRIFFVKNGSLDLIEDIYSDLGVNGNMVIRVKEGTEQLKEKLAKAFPELSIQLLASGVTLIDFPKNEADRLESISAFLSDNDKPEFSVGKMTLGDLYSKYYH